MFSFDLGRELVGKCHLGLIQSCFTFYFGNLILCHCVFNIPGLGVLDLQGWTKPALCFFDLRLSLSVQLCEDEVLAFFF